MTVWTDNANAFATRDTDTHADMLLDVACKEAIRLYRAGRYGRAEYVIARAALSAARILGGA